MENNIRIAKDLIRLARTLLAFNRKELERQLLSMNIPGLNVEENLDSLDKMMPKEQKAALYWIKKKSMVLPRDEKTFNNAMNLVNKQHLDYQQFSSPEKVLDRDDKSTAQIKARDMFNLDSEPTFTNKKSLKNGITVYWVEDSKEGQKAIRKALDHTWGYDFNGWCLEARKSKFGPDQLREIERMSEDQKERLGFYSDDDLAVAWGFWERYNAYPKRAAFKGNEIIALCASDKKSTINWWNKQNQNTENIPGLEIDDDDIDFLVKYGKNTLVKCKNVPIEILEKLADDKGYYVRKNVAYNLNTPAEALKKLANDKNKFVRKNVAENPNTPAETLKKLADDKEENVRERIALNPNTPAEALKKLADDKEENVREGVASNLNTPVETLEKLADDENIFVRVSVVLNQNTSVKILEKLADDEDEWIRGLVASNSNTPIETLKKLADDENEDIRNSALKNLNKDN